MIRCRLSQIALELEGVLHGPDAEFAAVNSDSRTLAPGELFVALSGERFDGHDYLAEVAARGAVAALVERPIAAPLPTLQVADARVALGRLAAWWRRQSAAEVIAVTGSNGKTTLKEMIAAILSRQFGVLATRGNLNNDIGLPLTLLRLQGESHAVVELGANHPGEIDYLSRIAQPDVAVLNNAGRAHLEGFGSVEGVARAKAEIIHGLRPQGVFVYNADDPWAGLWRQLAVGRTALGFGLCEDAAFSSPANAAGLQWREDGFRMHFPVITPAGELEIELPLAGEHNRRNALAAIAAAQLVGAGAAAIREGLAGMRPVKGRLQTIRGRDGLRLIDDSYNANPDSVGAAVAVLATAPGRRLLVLGELAELGPGAEGFYSQLGVEARQAGIDRLYAVGPAWRAADAFGVGGCGCADRDELISTLERELERDDVVLVKGSRRAGMERVIAAFADDRGN